MSNQRTQLFNLKVGDIFKPTQGKYAHSNCYCQLEKKTDRDIYKLSVWSATDTFVTEYYTEPREIVEVM